MTDMSDGYRMDLANFEKKLRCPTCGHPDSAKAEELMHRYFAALGKACNFVFETLGKDNFLWMKHARLGPYGDKTFDQIRNEYDARMMERVSDDICSGRLPVSPPTRETSA